jgi:hypothetical protein
MTAIYREIRFLLESLDIDPDTALCAATTDSQGDRVRCGKPFGHDDRAHVGKSNGWDVVW